MENKKNIPNTVFNAYLNQIKSDTMENSKIKEHITNGIFDVHELVREGYLSQKKHDELYPPPYISIEEQKNIYLTQIKNGELTDKEIENLVDDEKPIRIPYDEWVRIPYDEWEDVPPLQLNRIDVFMFGMAGAGRTSLLASLLKYGNDKGLIKLIVHSVSGYNYANTLIEMIGDGKLCSATAVDHIQNIACDIQDSKRDIHPLTFIEMSGEHFQDSYGRDMKYLKEKKPKLVEYLFENPNQKVIFFTIDFQHTFYNYNAGKYIEFMLRFLESNDMMEKLEAIILVVTKVDEKGNDIEQKVKEFLEQKYKIILAICNEYEKKYNIDFFVHKFSLGVFKDQFVYEHDPSDSEKIFDLLANTISKKISKNKKSNSLWAKIFGKKNK